LGSVESVKAISNEYKLLDTSETINMDAKMDSVKMIKELKKKMNEFDIKTEMVKKLFRKELECFMQEFKEELKEKLNEEFNKFNKLLNDSSIAGLQKSNSEMVKERS